MALTDRDRSVLYQGLNAIVGDEQAVEAMLSHFPIQEADQPATVAQLDARLAQIDVRFAQMDDRFTQIDARFAQIDDRFAQIDARFAQIDARFAQIDVRFAEMETRLTKEFHQAFRAQTQWLVGVLITWGTVVIAASRLG